MSFSLRGSLLGLLARWTLLLAEGILCARGAHHRLFTLGLRLEVNRIPEGQKFGECLNRCHLNQLRSSLVYDWDRCLWTWCLLRFRRSASWLRVLDIWLLRINKASGSPGEDLDQGQQAFAQNLLDPLCCFFVYELASINSFFNLDW